MSSIFSTLVPTALVLIAGVMAACDEAPAGVSISAVASQYMTCSSLSYSKVTFTLVNEGAAAITPREIALTVPHGGLRQGFAAAAPIAPGASVDYHCFGGFVGSVAAAPESSRVTFDYLVNGHVEQVRTTGNHSSSQAFDACDTAFPQTGTVDCAAIEGD